jgi:hypothetical protein
MKSMPDASGAHSDSADRHATQHHFANFGAFRFHDVETVFKYMIY